MRSLKFETVTGLADRHGRHDLSLQIDERTPQDATLGLWQRRDGSIFADDFQDAGLDAVKLRADRTLLAQLRCVDEDDTRSWYLVPHTRKLALNSQVQLLPIVRLEAGTLLSIGQQYWLITTLWTPKQSDAPAQLAHKPCAVCGAALELSPVVQCSCGRWSHLERPEDPDDDEALNCYLISGHCGGCGREASLEAQTFPRLPAWLIDRRNDED